MNKTIGELSEKYKIIGDQFLKSIEEFVLGTSSKCSPIMKEYYYYWERRIYNALFKMILRALISFKALVYQPVAPSGKCYPLFQIKANYEHPYFTTNPTYNELYDILNNIPNNIIASTKNFWRWMDGTCEFCRPGKGPNDEVLQKHTFHTDIEQNNIIIKVKFLLGLGIKKANDRARKFREMFEPDPETKDANK
jgi:dynein heavy chain, axonemal